MITHIPTKKTIRKLRDAGEGKFTALFYPGNEPEEMVVTAEEIHADGGVKELQRVLSRPPPVRINYNASNGLSINRLRDWYKCKVKTLHYRNATFRAKVMGVMVALPCGPAGIMQRMIPIKQEEQLVPTYYKSLVDFSARGGETVIWIETPSGQKITTSSKCHEKDNFCYKLGVKNALEHLYPDEVEEIIKGLIINEDKRDAETLIRDLRNESNHTIIESEADQTLRKLVDVK